MQTVKHEKDRILVLCDHFDPGFRAGGPITTICNMITRLSSIYEFYIITRDRDLLSIEPYDILLYEWVKYPDSHRYYISQIHLSFAKLKKLIEDISPRIIYLNSFFSYTFSIKILILKKLQLINNCSILLSPRGELKESALLKGRIKKMIYIKLSKFFSLYSPVLWQATNTSEEKCIKRLFNTNVKLVVASNITRPITKTKKLDFNIKKEDSLKLVFVGRIHRIKNLLYSLEILSEVKGEVEFDIIGLLEDHSYWTACKKMIDVMPENIHVNYIGDIPNNQVIRRLQNYHFLFLLSKGENFGQSIFEALSVGLPVITSNQTPWVQLEEKNAGWNLPLDSTKLILDKLNYCFKMNQTTYNNYVNGAISFASNYESNSGAFEANKTMFKTALQL